jgi:hypothetical protein
MQHTTLFTLLSTAVAVVLHEQTGAPDVVLGTQRSLRQHPGLHEQIGLLIDSIPLRIAVRPHDTAAELMQRVSRIVQEAITHGRIGYGRLLDLMPSRGAPPSGALISAVVQYVSARESVALPPVTPLHIEDVTVPETTLPYPLVVEATDGLDGTRHMACSIDSTIHPTVLETLTAQLPSCLEWLTGLETSPLASRPTAGVVRAMRTTRPRISLDLT